MLTRGGGSLEDLWCFNSEHLAHAIYNSALPIISAVGHEIDTTISDYVADVRAPTPSAGAELLSKDKGNKTEKLALLLSRLQQGMKHYQLQQYGRLTQLSHQLQRHEPQRKLQQFEQRFDEMQMRLENALQHKFSRLTLRHQQLYNRLQQRSPINTLTLEKQRLGYLIERFNDASKDCFKQAELRLTQAAHKLDTVSPLATLSRGYSITSTNDHVVENANQLSNGDVIHTRLKQGSVTSTVTDISTK